MLSKSTFVFILLLKAKTESVSVPERKRNARKKYSLIIFSRNPMLLCLGQSLLNILDLTVHSAHSFLFPFSLAPPIVTSQIALSLVYGRHSGRKPCQYLEQNISVWVEFLIPIEKFPVGRNSEDQ